MSLSSDSEHRFSKHTCQTIRLIAGLRVEGNAHAGKTVQHLSRIAKDPTVPNLRQVHLIHAVRQVPESAPRRPDGTSLFASCIWLNPA